MSILVAYFSKSGENYFPQGIKSVDKGNTAKVAEMIAEQIEADVFEIKPQQPYPSDYDECTEVAKRSFINRHVQSSVSIYQVQRSTTLSS